MGTLPHNSPTAFCTAFIARELADFKEKEIWMSAWPTMERIIERCEELTIAFDELIGKYGYSDTLDPAATQTSKEAVWLILEHIWCGADYEKDKIIQARNERKSLFKIDKEVLELAESLSTALKKQADLYEKTGFSRQDYQSSTDVLKLAGTNNYLFKSYISEKIQRLNYQYDLKYWPSRAELVEAIASFERTQSSPHHYELTDEVLNGRKSTAKDFVISFDNHFNELNGLPNDFRFSNKAMAAIINVVLDLDPDQMVEDHSVRLIRNRYKL